jgi:D-3-phosphoglycerate dehydrogenase
MQPTVAIAYGNPENFDVENRILGEINAKLHIPDMKTPEAREIIANADALMVTTHLVPAEMIDTMKNCRIISRSGTGLDAIDLQHAANRNIWVAYVPDYSIDEVSTHAIALMLTFARAIPQVVAAAKNNDWSNRTAVPSGRLSNQTYGVFGFGRIGQASARKAAGLGMRVIAYDRYMSEDQIREAGAIPVDWDTLLSESDYITLHAPLTPDTQKVMNAEAFAKMKSSAVLINTARGGLIDEEALDQALTNGVIRGAGVDVLSVEPPPADHILLHNPRAIVTPHTGWYSEEASIDVRVRAAEEVVRVFRGERPRCPANQPVQQ